MVLFEDFVSCVLFLFLLILHIWDLKIELLFSNIGIKLGLVLIFARLCWLQFFLHFILIVKGYVHLHSVTTESYMPLTNIVYKNINGNKFNLTST